jgi:hypothetical protein
MKDELSILLDIADKIYNTSKPLTKREVDEIKHYFRSRFKTIYVESDQIYKKHKKKKSKKKKNKKKRR